MGSLNGHITEDLLVRYLLEECNELERAQVEEWINADKANRAEFYAVKKALDISTGGTALPEIDVDEAWQRLSKSIQPSSKVIPLKASRPFPWAYAVAAVAVVLVGLYFFNQWSGPSVEQQFSAQNESVSQTLADNSLIVLSPNSKVEASIGKKREIKLSGKAYFEVEPDKERPFVVHTALQAKDVTISVLGTAFNIIGGEYMVRTEVREGKVRMEADGDFIELEAGEVGVCSGSGAPWKIEAPSIQTWGERIMVFSGTPLKEVVEHLQINYSVKISLANAQIAQCRLTATFDNEDINDILEVIASTFDLELKSTGSNAFLLDGEGC